MVYSPAHNDNELLAEYHIDTDEEKKLRKEFIKKGTLPKILIVTEKLLTGFDAPILYAMYLDKPMRDHVLLQAIARVIACGEGMEGLFRSSLAQRRAGGWRNGPFWGTTDTIDRRTAERLAF